MAELPQDPSTIPLAQNPSGDPPNFDGGPSLQPTVLGTGIMLITISLIVVILRLFTGFKNTRKLHIDDYFCAGAEILCVAYWFVLYEQVQIKQGIGKHSWDIPVSAVTESVTKGQSVAQILTSLANPLAKGSILFFFVRLFGTLRWVKITCYTLIVFTFLAYLAYLAALLAFCIPRGGEPWASNLTERCASTAPATIAMGVIALVIDLAMFIIPFIIIPKLNLSRNKKMGLATVFLFGFLIVVTTAVGLAYRVIIERGTPDPTWNGANVSITSYTEIFGTIIVSCAPALSSFWIRTLTQTQTFQSLRTTFSLSRLRGSKSSRSNLHKDPESNRFSQHVSDSEHYQKQRQGSNTSQQELVEVSPPTDSQAIKKHTVITQHSEEDTRPTDQMQLRHW